MKFKGRPARVGTRRKQGISVGRDRLDMALVRPERFQLVREGMRHDASKKERVARTHPEIFRPAALMIGGGYVPWDNDNIRIMRAPQEGESIACIKTHECA